MVAWRYINTIFIEPRPAYSFSRVFPGGAQTTKEMLLSEAMQAYLNVVHIGTPCHGRFATKMLRKVVGTTSSGSFVVIDTFLQMYLFMVAQE